MADVKWSNNGVFIPQASFGNNDNIMGITGSNVNAKYPKWLFLKGTGSSSTHNTSVTLIGSEIVGGIIRSTPASSGVVLGLPTVASIYSAMGGSPAIGSFVYCQIENLSEFSLALTKTDVDLLITGLVSVFIGPTQTFYLKFSVTSLSPLQITVDGGQSSGITNSIEKLIVISNAGSDTSGTGTLERPYATLQHALDNSTIGQSTILITPGSYSGNAELLPSVGLVGFGNQLSVVSGNITINQTEWDATVNPHLDIEGIGFTGSLDLEGGSGSKYGSDFLRIKSCNLPSGTDIDKIGFINIINNTQASNLSISSPGNVFIQSKLINGSITFNEGNGLTLFPIIEIDEVNIDRLNANLLFGNLLLPPFKITNCPYLGTGTLDFYDQTEGGSLWDITVDAISYPTTIISHVGTSFTIQRFQNIATGAVTSSITGPMLSSNISGIKTFTDPTLLLEVQNPLVSNCTPVNLTATTATISAAQLCGGALTLNPVLSATYTLPNATDIQSFLNGINSNRGFWVTMVNQSALLVTLSPGTNTTLAGAFLTAAVVSIPAASSRIFRVVKTDNTPTYVLFG